MKGKVRTWIGMFVEDFLFYGLDGFIFLVIQGFKIKLQLVKAYFHVEDIFGWYRISALF